MTRKSGKTFAEEGSVADQNPRKNSASDEQRKKYTKDFMKLEDKIDELRDDQKKLLNRAKNEGILKTAIRKAAKTLYMNAKSFQAQNEVDRETKHIVQLFAEEGGQYSWLQPDPELQSEETEDAA